MTVGLLWQWQVEVLVLVLALAVTALDDNLPLAATIARTKDPNPNLGKWKSTPRKRHEAAAEDGV